MNTNVTFPNVITQAVIIFDKEIKESIRREVRKKLKETLSFASEIHTAVYIEEGKEAFKKILAKLNHPLVIGFGRGASYFEDYNDYSMRFYISPKISSLQHFKYSINHRDTFLVLSKSSEDTLKYQNYASYFSGVGRTIYDRPLTEIEGLRVVKRLIETLIEQEYLVPQLPPLFIGNPLYQN